MALKLMCLVVLAALVYQGHALTEMRLEDQEVTYQSNPLLGRGISIYKWMFDTLESCHVTFPNGRVLEAFPDNKLDVDTISFMYSAQPFTSCGIQFNNSPESLSGTYELMSVVTHSSNSSLTLARQRFTVNIVKMEGWQEKLH